MNTSSVECCETCSALLPKSGYFCGKCLSQFKCKKCDAVLEKEYVGCVICGTPRQDLNYSKQNSGTNTFRIYETKEERTIEASFSDIVGKDVAGILRDAAANKRHAIDFNTYKESQEQSPIFETEDVNSEVIYNENGSVIKPHDLNNANFNDYPSLRAIAMKKLPGSEPEWVIVYAFYASNFGEEIFTRQQLVEKYKESGRVKDYDTTRLSTNLSRMVQAGHINPLSENFSILDSGIQKAKDIISRTVSAVSKTKSNVKKATSEKPVEENEKTSPKKTTKKLKGLKKLNNINFEPQGKVALKILYDKYAFTNDQERNLIFIYYLSEILEIVPITFDHIYTCYDVLDLKVSENLPQTVRNAASRTGWIELKDSTWSVTIKGSNKIKEWNKALNK